MFDLWTEKQMSVDGGGEMMYNGEKIYPGGIAL
jgi:hypothetical protein